MKPIELHRRKIKLNASVFIDFRFERWTDTNIEFEAKPISGRPGWVELVGPNYGLLGQYGAGSIFAEIKDLI
jgi:hypothetical protein